jgi:hypothetical protein
MPKNSVAVPVTCTRSPVARRAGQVLPQKT